MPEIDNSELADLLKNPKAKEKKTDPAKMLALILANQALNLAGAEGAFLDEDGNPDFKKAIPTIPWTT